MISKGKSIFLALLVCAVLCFAPGAVEAKTITVYSWDDLLTKCDNDGTTIQIPEDLTVIIDDELIVEGDSANYTLTGTGILQRSSTYDGPLITLDAAGGTLHLERLYIAGGCAANDPPSRTVEGSLLNVRRGTVTLSDAFLYENVIDTVDGYGGAIRLHPGAACTVTNSAISNNGAKKGGAVYVDATTEDAASFTMLSGDITDNKAEEGVGIYVAGGGVAMPEMCTLGGSIQILDDVYLASSSAYLSLGSALAGNVTIPLTVNASAMAAGKVMVKGVSSYSLSAADIAKVLFTDTTWALSLNVSENKAVLAAQGEEDSSGVYLDGVQGNDDNPGTISAPVKTFGRAKELLAADGVIYICDTVTIVDDEVWSLPESAYGDVAVKPGVDGPLTLVDVPVGASLTLEDVIIDGDAKAVTFVQVHGDLSAAPEGTEAGKLIIHDGVSLRNSDADGYDMSAGLLIEGELLMNGGRIENNRGGCGTVLLRSVGEYTAQFVLNGGIITGNRVAATAPGVDGSGGGVRVMGKSVLTVTAGAISGNSAEQGNHNVEADADASVLYAPQDSFIESLTGYCTLTQPLRKPLYMQSPDSGDRRALLRGTAQNILTSADLPWVLVENVPGYSAVLDRGANEIVLLPLRDTEVETTLYQTCAGNTINVDVRITGNPGLAGFAFDTRYDTAALTLTQIAAGPLLKDANGTFAASTETGRVRWDGNAAIAGDGVIYTLTFAVANDVTEGIYTVTAAPADDDAANLWDEASLPIASNYLSGGAMVADHQYTMALSTPSVQHYSVGDQVVVDIYAYGASATFDSYGAFAGALSYDQDLLTLDTIAPANHDLSPSYFAYNGTNGTFAYAHPSATPLPISTDVQSPTKLATATFTVKSFAGGSSQTASVSLVAGECHLAKQGQLYFAPTLADSATFTVSVHNLSVTFQAGSGISGSTVTAYVRYNQAGLYASNTYQEVLAVPTYTAAENYRLPAGTIEEPRWINGLTAYATDDVVTTATFTENVALTMTGVRQYSVHFYDANGQRIGAIQRVDDGGRPEVVTAPAIINADFEGWWLADVSSAVVAADNYPDGAPLYDGTDIIVNEDMYLKAHYTVHSYAGEAEIIAYDSYNAAPDGQNLVIFKPDETVPHGMTLSFHSGGVAHSPLYYSEAYDAWVIFVDAALDKATVERRIMIASGRKTTVLNDYDVNCNGRVEAVDAMIVHDLYLDLHTDEVKAQILPEMRLKADAVVDRSVDTMDVVKILRSSLGLS